MKLVENITLSLYYIYMEIQTQKREKAIAFFFSEQLCVDYLIFNFVQCLFSLEMVCVRGSLLCEALSKVES